MHKRYTVGEPAVRPGLYWMLDNGRKIEAWCTVDAINNISNNCDIYEGTFYGGHFHGGRYLGGIYYGGTFTGGKFDGGMYFGGVLHDGSGIGYSTYYGGSVSRLYPDKHTGRVAGDGSYYE